MVDLKNIILSYPVNGIITQSFGENPDNYASFFLPGHNGVDFGVPIGTPIFPAADGIVKFVGFDKSGYGNYLIIEHGGFQTLYAHLKDILVNPGDLISGSQLGRSGNTGNSTGPHLHFELRVPGHGSKGYPSGELDPLPFFAALEPQFDNGLPPANDAIKPGTRFRLADRHSHVNMRSEPVVDESTWVGKFLPGMTGMAVERDGVWVKADVSVWIYTGYLEIVE